jgi:hypothetical protein
MTTKPKTRYRIYIRGEEHFGPRCRDPLRIAIHPDETTMNPDPDGRHSRLLQFGWTCVQIDPIPGLEMVRRPISFLVS